MQEVSRSHSTLSNDRGRGEPSVLNPNYVVGFVDGEGCFCISVSKHNTLKRKLEIRAEFEIELRIDDRPILERIQKTLDCGKIYQLNYPRYKWGPHVKLKVSNIKDLKEKIVPFFEKYPLQAKKAKTFKFFSQIVQMIYNKEHLTDKGYNKILELREQMRKTGKKTPLTNGRTSALGTARVRENRSLSGVGRRHDPNTARHVKRVGNTRISSQGGRR